MIKYCFIIFLTLSLTTLQGQITRIDHLYLKAKALFNFCTEQLGFPIAWEFNGWGDFKSGGLSLGNANLEFIQLDGLPVTKFEGIALEPQQKAAVILQQLEPDEV